jgi:ElaB/YqjD/DUF883 family membrane-anchored ribosome-binding protein
MGVNLLKERNMDNQQLETATGPAVNLAHLTHELSKAKVLVEDAIDDGKHKVERLLKRGYSEAEDYVDDTRHYIKHHPWQSVGIALGVGTGAGLVFGWLLSRMRTNCAASNNSELLTNLHSGE